MERHFFCTGLWKTRLSDWTYQTFFVSAPYALMPLPTHPSFQPRKPSRLDKFWHPFIGLDIFHDHKDRYEYALSTQCVLNLPSKTSEEELNMNTWKKYKGIHRGDKLLKAWDIMGGWHIAKLSWADRAYSSLVFNLLLVGLIGLLFAWFNFIHQRLGLLLSRSQV